MNELKEDNIKVLLVDDDEDDYFIIKRIFSKIPHTPFELHWTNNYDEAYGLVQSNKFDVFLIDYRLGAHTGLELLQAARASKRSEPFLILTGTGDTTIEQESIKLAAADYLVKGNLNPSILSRALYYALGRKQIEDQRVQHYIELNKTKDEFISLASHQLRTPATGVKQYLGMVLQGMAGEVPESQRALLAKAYESNERQLTIVSDLLKVAQVDAGKVHIHQLPVGMVELLRDIAKEQMETYEMRKQELVLNVPEEEIIAYVDQAKIRMVFENLIDNASKYSEAGKKVFVNISKDDNWVTVSIRDDGVGIEASDIPKLFEKFSRIYNHLSTEVGGTGLGLYWAKNIIDLHKGMIQVSSEPGEGTEFKVSLPVQPNEDEHAKNYEGKSL